MQKKALLEVIPPRICITFRRASFWSRPENLKIRIWDDRVENTINTAPERHDNFSGNVQNHENRSKLDPYSTNRAENQGFWISKPLPIQWDPSWPPKQPYKIQNRPKIQWTQPTQLSTKFGHQPKYLTFHQTTGLLRRTSWLPGSEPNLTFWSHRSQSLGIRLTE